MTNSILSFQHVSFRYGAETIFSDASLNIEKGDFVCMIGPNGAGKTTFVKLSLGMVQPQQGTILLFGQPLPQFREWYRIGYVPQKVIAFDHLFPASVFEVVSMGRVSRVGLFRRFREEDYRAIDHAIHVCGIDDLREKRIGDLSGGQQQRVFIARALAGEPSFLILDEPTTGIDKKSQHEFYSLLTRLNRTMGVTLLLISHDVGAVAKTANKIACVHTTITVHDASEGINEALRCAYGEDVSFVPHHHDPFRGESDA